MNAIDGYQTTFAPLQNAPRPGVRMLFRHTRMLIAGALVCWTSSCHPAPALAPAPSVPPRPPTVAGVVSYDDGTPAAAALLVVTNLTTGRQASILSTDRDGRFQSTLPEGDYSLSAITDRGSALIEKQLIPATTLQIPLSRSCHRLTGHVRGHAGPTIIQFWRESTPRGVFAGQLHEDGRFALCLPAGTYDVVATGATLSLQTEIEVPATTAMEIDGIAASEVKRAAPAIARIPARFENLVDDISHRDPVIIGLGEATHGTAEFVQARGELTFALIRSAGVRLLLFEVDAISARALDDYVNGADVDLAKALPALGFWITDTYEFRRFLGQVRQYNTGVTDKVHLWGIDVQNTDRPVDVLLRHAARLSIGDSDQAILKVAAQHRGKDAANLAPDQRASLDALLSRLQVAPGHDRDDLLVAVAARSLAIQLTYWDDDARGRYGTRRDAGMANLARFLVSQPGVRRACLWAHDGHITKEGDSATLGQHLASDPALRYYGIGFYLYEGSTRAWDGGGKIGVIPHAISAAPPFTIEGAVMQLTGMPDTAWLPLRHLPAPLQRWLDEPRFVREVGHTYFDEDTAMMLRRIARAFDAVVVLKTVHDSSPTPTGIRTAKPD